MKYKERKIGQSMGSRAVQSIYNQIRSKILFSGPIPVADYMRLALTQNSMNLRTEITGVSSNDTLEYNKNYTHTDAGYYMKKDVFGTQGDFITSPEISQIFGEMIAVWGLQTWLQIGGPKKFNIVELGPGRGTLAKDILRVFSRFEYLTGNNVSLHLVEISPFLANVQQQTLCEQKTRDRELNKKLEKIDLNKDYLDGNTFYHQGISCDTGFPVYWYRDIKDVPKEFNLYIAHEFFDALPVHKLQKCNNDWREVLVDINSDEQSKLRFVLSRNETPVIKLMRSHYDKILLDSRNHIEVSLEAFRILEEITTRLEENGGIALIVDYGHEGTKEDTFRGFANHRLHDPLTDPGTADLTADVDFSFIQKLFSDKTLVCGPVTQREFLSRVGINTRLQKLMDNCINQEKKQELLSGYNMLMEDMGSRFLFMSFLPKVLAAYKPKLSLAGFDE